ncbi:pollen ole e 1 allergen and extensin family protein [Citrus sinensis]|uniref:Pollen ole e 1 allergen and extensin family protein n=1 Tax=Citrus sinensis TaxID=2711 RepID=A0ACB8IAK3_CITSI|nr:pollen ole e 1 allergen and extensin family protein [Citrus sinensis]
MALKSFLFVSIMLATETAPIAEAQFGLIGGILGLIRIQGTVFCTANGNMGVNGTATPAFPMVNTPLASCNAKLPAAGGLISSLQFIGNTLLGLLNVANTIPAGFQFIP